MTSWGTESPVGRGTLLGSSRAGLQRRSPGDPGGQREDPGRSAGAPRGWRHAPARVRRGSEADWQGGSAFLRQQWPFGGAVCWKLKALRTHRSFLRLVRWLSAEGGAEGRPAGLEQTRESSVSETRGVCSRRRKQQTARNATKTRRGQKICFLAFTVIKERPTSARTVTTSPQRRWDLCYRELEGGSGWSKCALLTGHSPRRPRWGWPFWQPTVHWH